MEWDLSSTLYIFQWNYGKIHKVRKTARGGLHSLVYSPYSDDGFCESELDITDKVTTLVLDKLYDDYNLDDGDELLITKATNKNKNHKITL